KTIDMAVAYLKNRVRRRETTKYYYQTATNQMRLEKEIAPKELIYSLYVLALANQKDLNTMNYYKSNLNKLAFDSRYLLACTFLLMGDENSFNSLLPINFKGEISTRQSGGSFHSPLKDLAMSLLSLIESKPNHPQIQPMTRHLVEQFSKEKYPNTVENAFALLAIGKLANKSKNSKTEAVVLSDGKEISKINNENQLFSKTWESKSPNLTIENLNEGNVYYYVSTEGFTEQENLKEEDSYLSVRRVFLNRNGDLISNLKFKQNDLIVVKIVLENQEKTNIENIVITDLLPAGFEIENPRITSTAQFNWLNDADAPEYIDIKDDRINLFTSIHKNKKVFYYMARAVSKGTYKLGSIAADAMYQGDYHSYSGSGWVLVE
ncbi:MAG: alpha-2-macroglobulin family protein, partial [Cytophagales bacterium]